MKTANDTPDFRSVQSCPACGGLKFKTFALTSDIAHETTDMEFEYVRCSKCASILMRQPPEPQEMGRFYPKQYDQHVFPLQAERSGALGWHAEKLHAKICCRYPFFRLRRNFFGSMSVEDLFLDYGCGAGEALDQAARHGAKTVGVDFVDELLDQLNQRGHVGLSAAGDWVSSPALRGGASRIRLNHSLEHVHDPRALLQQIAATAKPGCKLQLSVPNPEGLSARVFKRNWWGLEAPRHLVLLSSEQICRMLDASGFTVTDVCTEPTGKDVARSLGITAWRWSLLKDKNVARNFQRYAPALILGLALGMMATVIGRGDRLHIYAEKR